MKPRRAHRSAYAFWVRPVWEEWRAGRTTKALAVAATVDVLGYFGARGQGAVLRDIRIRFGWRPGVDDFLKINYPPRIGAIDYGKSPWLQFLARHAQ